MVQIPTKGASPCCINAIMAEVYATLTWLMVIKAPFKYPCKNSPSAKEHMLSCKMG